MRFLKLIIFLSFSNFTLAQFTEELVEIRYETNELVSIKTLPDVPYIDQMLGGVTVNTDDNYYIFTGQGSDTYLYTLDIPTGEIIFKVDVPQIQMIQYNGTDELIGISKGNPTNEVALSRYNYKTGALNSFPPISILEGAAIDTHNSAIDEDGNIFYFVGSISGTNIWSIIAIDIANGTLIKSIDIMPNGEFLAGLAYDKEKNKLLGIVGNTPNGKSLIEVDPVAETFSEIKKLPELINTFGGHRYWAYDDTNNKFFIIGLDALSESHLYVIDGNTGNILFQNPYEDEAWIMEEHSPLELRYSPNTNQLLGLRKGPTLPPVSNNNLTEKQNSLNIFPNPIMNNLVNVKITNGELIRQIQVFDLNGNVLLEENNIGSSNAQFESNQLASGIYFIGVKTEKNYWYQTLIKH